MTTIYVQSDEPDEFDQWLESVEQRWLSGELHNLTWFGMKNLFLEAHTIGYEQGMEDEAELWGNDESD